MKISTNLFTVLLSFSILTTAFADPGKAYVTNQEGGVSVIDLETLKSTGNINIEGKGPRGIGITQDGQFLITANKDDDNISVVNLKDNTVRHINVGKNPEFVRINGNFAFVSTEPSSTGGPPPKQGEQTKDDDEDSKTPARIAVVDLIKGVKIREIIGGPETEGIEFSNDGKFVIISNEADNTITVHDYLTGNLVKTIYTHSYGDRPRGIKASPDGNFYIATLEFSNKFIVIDKNFNILRAVPTGQAPYGVSFDKLGSRIYIASAKEKSLQVYDAKTFDKIKDVPTGNRCWHFSFTPDEKYILLACGKSNAVIVVDTEKLEKTSEISDKEVPWGIVTFPKSMGSLDKP